MIIAVFILVNSVVLIKDLLLFIAQIRLIDGNFVINIRTFCV